MNHQVSELCADVYLFVLLLLNLFVLYACFVNKSKIVGTLVLHVMQDEIGQKTGIFKIT